MLPLPTLTIAAALASGALVGALLGLFGGGGSVLATPLLLYVVGIRDPHMAIGTSAAVAVNAGINLIGHARVGRVKWPCALVFAGTACSARLPAQASPSRWMASACCCSSPSPWPRSPCR